MSSIRRYIAIANDVWSVVTIFATVTNTRKQDAIRTILIAGFSTLKVKRILLRANLSPSYLKALAKLK
jgi:hypothetical protein